MPQDISLALDASLVRILIALVIPVFDMNHKLNCPAYSNYQPPYEDCNCGAEQMTTLNDVHGLNEYCGPSVLSIFTGETTDRCAAVIGAVSGKKVIKAVDRAHLKEAFKRLRFDVEITGFSGSSLFGVLFRMRAANGLYAVFVPHHVIAVEVRDKEIFLCDNHSKQPLDIRQSARLSQKVEEVWKVFPHQIPKLLTSELKIVKGFNGIEIFREMIYENKVDNYQSYIGGIKTTSQKELEDVLYKLHCYYESGEFEQ